MCTWVVCGCGEGGGGLCRCVHGCVRGWCVGSVDMCGCGWVWVFHVDVCSCGCVGVLCVCVHVDV